MSRITANMASVGGNSLESEWRPLALSGAIIGLIGILAMAFPLVTGLSVSLAIGALLVVGGIVHGVHAFTVRGWRGSAWQAALAIVSVIAGLAVLAAPTVALLTLTLALVAYFAVDGVAELATAMRMERSSGRAAVAFSGIISFVLAGLLWVGFPATADWAIGLLVGVNLLVIGLAMVTIAVTSRPGDVATPPETEPHSA